MEQETMESLGFTKENSYESERRTRLTQERKRRKCLSPKKSGELFLFPEGK
jgi:hypothetical protein